MAPSMPKISVNSGDAAVKSKSKAQVADSWEDEDVSDTEPASAGPVLTPSIPTAPPPTPISPSLIQDQTWMPAGVATGAGLSDGPARRPEKTDAVARRMIAASLGLKAPKLTDEQKAYQKSVKEQEKRKREQEKEEAQRRQEEAEKAKAAVWDD
ncbi:hypothetical protein B0I35DRAFT_403739 [Stachybotrys elegans]|uniref:Ubiquitin smt3 n=1 Tax=Stachybotrys elegans TaxID=80388 RepID=A0A8K0T1V4_9HYPO|nr:hypothetical protein B0I35DRAFT_403739 [Stachybotrys elegans]